MPCMTPKQCSGARGVLQWSYKRLAKEAGLLDYRVTARFEKGHNIKSSTFAVIRKTLLENGIAFAEDGLSISWVEA